MERNGFAALFLLLFLTLASFSDASLVTTNLRTVVVRRDSLPGSPEPIPGKVTEEKKPDSKPVSEDKTADKSNKNVESSQGNKLDSGLESQSKDKNLNSIEGNGSDKDKKVVTEPLKKESEEKKLDSEPEKQPNKQEKPDPKPSDKTIKEEKKPGSEQTTEPSEEKKKSDSGSVKNPSEQKTSDPGKVKEVGKPPPPPPKDPVVTKSLDNSDSLPAGEKTQKKEEDKVEKKKKEDKSGTGTLTDEICDGLKPSCIVQDLIGCIKSADGSQVVVLVQNKGENVLKANVAEEDSSKGIESSEIPKKKSILIPISLSNPKASHIVLHGVKGQCELPLPSPGDEENSFLKIPTYDKLVTPVNGAYLIILTALVFAATFACIKFSRRRRQGGGIPYQELEMGLPESVSAEDVETAEGWDQGWDDDWDNGTVKSPSAHHSVSISANGLTSRSPNKDGWEDNWDD